MAKNAFQVQPPELLTVETLRKYLDDMEELWNDKDVQYLGEFKRQRINIMHTEQPNVGIGPAKIVYDGCLDFIILPGKI